MDPVRLITDQEDYYRCQLLADALRDKVTAK